MPNTKTMERIAGAASSMKLLDTPFRVFKEARRKGDIPRMKRAMEYVGKFAEKAGSENTDSGSGAPAEKMRMP